MIDFLVLYMLTILDKSLKKNCPRLLDDESIEIPYRDITWKPALVFIIFIRLLGFNKYIEQREHLFGCFERLVKRHTFNYYKMLSHCSSYCRSNKLKREELRSEERRVGKECRSRWS